MRILAFCDYYGDSSVGGAEIVARELYRRLAEDYGAEITVVGALPNDVSGSGEGPVRVLSVVGRDLSRMLGAQMLISPDLGRRARAELAHFRPDLVHVNGLHFQSSLIGTRLAKRFDIPLVVTAHLGSVAAMPGPIRLVASLYDRLVAGRVARGADWVVAVSGAVADHVSSLGVRPDQITVAHNGVDHKRFFAVPRPSQQRWLKATIVGRLIANKGTLLTLDAVAMVRATNRDVRLTVVGEGPLEKAAKKRATAADLEGAVDFVGRVSNVEEWLRGSDVSLRPSYTEGLPLAVLESLACGTPVICSEVAGNLELIDDGTNGMVFPVGDVAGLAGCLERLYDDRETLAQMSENAVESAGRFSWDESTQIHMEVFDAVSSRSAGTLT